MTFELLFRFFFTGDTLARPASNQQGQLPRLLVYRYPMKTQCVQPVKGVHEATHAGDK